MKKIFNSFTSLSTGLKVLIIFTAIIVVSGVCGATYIINKNADKTVTTLAQAQEEKNKIPEDVITNIPEEIVQVAEEVVQEEEKEEEVVKYKDKEVKVPKSKVASVDSSEDAEKNKKTGGAAVSQEQAETMFENVGKKSMGIDVSHHQKNINWAQVKASGVEFAMIRVGFRGQTSGGIYEDAYFKTNMAGAVANGIKVGVYFYSTAINENEALEEAVWVVKKIAPYRITFPVVYDFEDFNAHRCANVGGAQATSNALTFLNFVKANGYEPMMYANKNDITTRMSRSSFNCKFWLAHYTAQTDYTGNVNMWQYTSKGTVPGINGWVDMNIAYFNYGSVAEPKHTHSFTEEVKNSYKAPTCEKAGSKILMCSCGDKKTEEIPALEHKFDKGTPKKEATCGVAGERLCKCTREGCTKTKIEPIKATGKHNYKDGVCSVCEAKDPDATKPQEHTCVFDKEISREEATCGKNGKITYKCSIEDCEKTKEDTETLKPTGKHDYKDGVCSICEAKDPGATKPEEHTCVFDKEISREEATCGKNGKITYKCSIEGCEKTKEDTESLKATGNHICENWQETVPPTQETEGEEKGTCTVCGNELTRVKEKLSQVQ